MRAKNSLLLQDSEDAIQIPYDGLPTSSSGNESTSGSSLNNVDDEEEEKEEEEKHHANFGLHRADSSHSKHNLGLTREAGDMAYLTANVTGKSSRW